MYTNNSDDHPAHGGDRLPFIVALLLLVVLNLHTLRNLSSIYLGAPLALYLFSAALCQTSVFPFARTPNATGGLLPDVRRLYYLYLFATVYVTTISPFWVELDEVLIAVPRLWFTLPFALVVMASVNKESHVRVLLLTYITLVAVGCLSVPFQLVFAPISWFHEASARASLERYASLFGNLTAVGIVGAIGLIAVLMLHMHVLLRLTLACAICLGLLCSLQKAAVVNLLLVPFVYLLFSRQRVTQRASRLLLTFGFILLIIAYLTVADERFGHHGEYLLSKIAGDDVISRPATVDDPSLSASMSDRLSNYVPQMLEENGPMSVLFGAGARGLAGTVGLPQYTMAHTTYGDVLFAGGFLFALLLIALQVQLFRAFWTLATLAHHTHNEMMQNNVDTILAMLVVVYVNCLGNSGMLIQPNESTVFYMSIGLAMGWYHKRAARLSCIRNK
ncbi:MAG: hypothetical protein NTW87_06030 [Planctomycetota bacterium]|nr:hypothetical protein [Planctomycetota bacterium]